MVDDGGWLLWVGSVTAGQGPTLFLYSCCAPGSGLGPMEPQDLITHADPPPREAHLAKSVGVFVWLLKYCVRGWEPEGRALLSAHEEEVWKRSSWAGDRRRSAVGTVAGRPGSSSALAAGNELGALQESQVMSSTLRPLTY